MTAIYFAWFGNSWVQKSLEEWDWETRPLNMLCSFVFLREYRRAAQRFGRPRATMLDSGAFSAWKSGSTINMDALCREIESGGVYDRTGSFSGWDEAVALDVIGDSEGSIRNSHIMRERGLNVIPVFHYGEPWEALDEYCKFFPRVGISCRFGEPIAKSIAWVEQCFARKWPFLFHSFGWVDLRILDRLPFDTCDATTWQMGPTAFGNWRSYGGTKLSVRCKTDSPLRLFGEIEHYLEMQRHLEERWKDQLTPVRHRMLGDDLATRRMAKRAA